jgi:hypothetical protein
VTIDNHTYTLRCELWRDFFPPTPPGGRPLVAGAIITEVDSLDVPDSIDITRLWVINDQEVWEPFFLEEGPLEPPQYQITKIARSGPQWPCGIHVDVVVRLEGLRGESYLVRAPEQEIECSF